LALAFSLNISCGIEIRLVNGKSFCSGRVEVYYKDQWGTVCDDSWDINDAAVVCRQMRCGEALRSGPIHLDNVACSGSENSITGCRHSSSHNCGHGEDAGVTCGVNIRLVNGTGSCSGRVEVYYNGEWGTVCDDSWDINDATVVCRQMGCGEALSVHSSAHFGAGSGPIHLDDVACSGSENSITSCSRASSQNCNHGEDAGVTCAGGVNIRLVNGTGSCSGRVEVYYNGEWGTVCDDSWDINDATVVCRQMGCGEALSVHSSAHFGAGSGPIHLDDVACSGSENSITSCSRASSQNCNHGEDAGVTCADIRLVNGNGFCSGRVEVYYNGEWGTVCDDSWDMNDAAVVCRQMRCGEAVSVHSSAHFGAGSGPIHLDDVACSGSENSITSCSRASSQNCNHGEDAGVICAGRQKLNTFILNL
uniref:SRCR domain-containing protein n=1 Tax=Astyanax mexicanus TaxID=7994 RepID=W5K0Z2_ASTMX